MTFLEITALAVGGLVFFWIILATLSGLDMAARPNPRAWCLPASAGVLLLVWTLWCFMEQGLLADHPGDQYDGLGQSDLV